MYRSSIFQRVPWGDLQAPWTLRAYHPCGFWMKARRVHSPLVSKWLEEKGVRLAIRSVLGKEGAHSPSAGRRKRPSACSTWLWPMRTRWWRRHWGHTRWRGDPVREKGSRMSVSTRQPRRQILSISIKVQNECDQLPSTSWRFSSVVFCLFVLIIKTGL